MTSTEQYASARDNVRARVEPHVHNARAHLPEKSQVQGALSWLAVSLAVLTIGGITFTGGAVVLAIATPIFLLLSPILVPLGTILVLFLGAAAATVAAISAVIWLYKYLRGEEPVYYDRVDAARSRIAGTAQDVKGWALDRVPDVQAARSA